MKKFIWRNFCKKSWGENLKISTLWLSSFAFAKISVKSTYFVIFFQLNVHPWKQVILRLYLCTYIQLTNISWKHFTSMKWFHGKIVKSSFSLEALRFEWKTRNPLSPKNISSSQLFALVSFLLDKTITFTKFLPKMRERENSRDFHT